MSARDLLGEIESNIALLTRSGGLLDHLRSTINVTVRNSQNETEARPKGYSSSPPWDGHHANTYFTILAEAVEMERDLRYRLTKNLQTDRGRTHESAKNAMNAVPALAAHQTDDVVASTARHIKGWVRTIKSVPAIDEVTRHVNLQAACPYCHDTTLFVPFDASGDVVCRNRECGDPDNDNQPYRWRRHDWTRLLDTLTTQEN